MDKAKPDQREALIAVKKSIVMKQHYYWKSKVSDAKLRVKDIMAHKVVLACKTPFTMNIRRRMYVFGVYKKIIFNGYVILRTLSHLFPRQRSNHSDFTD